MYRLRISTAPVGHCSHIGPYLLGYLLVVASSSVLPSQQLPQWLLHRHEIVQGQVRSGSGYLPPPIYDLHIVREHQVWLSANQDSGSIQSQSMRGRGTSELGDDLNSGQSRNK